MEEKERGDERAEECEAAEEEAEKICRKFEEANPSTPRT